MSRRDVAYYQHAEKKKIRYVNDSIALFYHLHKNIKVSYYLLIIKRPTLIQYSSMTVMHRIA